MTRLESETLRMKIGTAIATKHAAGNTAAPAFMEQSPVKSPWHLYSIFVVAALVFVGAGLLSAAEASLPGDALYRMKVGFVEPMHSAFRGTGEALARWEEGLINTRLKEAETLASAGELNDARREHVEELLDRHTARYVATLNTIEPERALGLEGGLRAVIWSHINILEQITVHASTTPAVENAAQLKMKAAKHMEDLRAAWSTPLRESATSSKEFIKSNVKGE